MCFSGLDAARFSGFYLTLLLPYRNMQHVESTNCILAQSLEDELFGWGSALERKGEGQVVLFPKVLCAHKVGHAAF